VLRGERDAPRDLRDRALALAARVIAFAPNAACGAGVGRATEILESGLAWRKFQAICEAQGGLREPGRAPYTHTIGAAQPGECSSIDNRRIAQVAKLAGAPRDATAGVELHVRLGERVAKGAPLYTVHAAARGELKYALEFATPRADIVRIEER
jgi:thymidine phosphorylase